MDQASFEQLCRDTATALNHPEPDVLVSRQQITINGIDIGIFFDEFDAADRIVCYIDIGEVPEGGREEILARMLAINLLTGTKTAGVYGLDPQRDHIVFVQHFLYPDMLTGESLAEILQAYSRHAITARDTLLNASDTTPLPELLARSFEPAHASLA